MAEHPPKKKRFSVLDKQLAKSLDIHQKRLDAATSTGEPKKKAAPKQDDSLSAIRKRIAAGKLEDKKDKFQNEKAKVARKSVSRRFPLKPKKKNGIISFLGLNK